MLNLIKSKGCKLHSCQPDCASELHLTAWEVLTPSVMEYSSSQFSTEQGKPTNSVHTRDKSMKVNGDSYKILDKKAQFTPLDAFNLSREMSQWLQVLLWKTTEKNPQKSKLSYGLEWWVRFSDSRKHTGMNRTKSLRPKHLLLHLLMFSFSSKDNNIFYRIRITLENRLSIL